MTTSNAISIIKKSIKSKQEYSNSAFVTLRSAFGYASAGIVFYAFLGARQAGKSYSVMKLFLNAVHRKKKVKLYWLRLTEASQRKLLANNAAKLVDPDLARKYKLKLKTKGTLVMNNVGTEKKPKYEEFCHVLALSTFYNDKGSGYFDKDFDGEYIVVLDEMNREKNEKNSFDIQYNFKNQLENLIRNTKANVKVIMIGNTLAEASDLLLQFGFIPQPGAFGRYVVRSKRLLIDYIPPTQKYKEMRAGSVVDILHSSDESTFTNEVEQDMSHIYTKRLIMPQLIIKFSDDKNSWFTIWDGHIIKKYNNESVNAYIAMRRYIQGTLYIKEKVEYVYQIFDSEGFDYANYISQADFRRQLRLLKPQTR